MATVPFGSVTIPAGPTTIGPVSLPIACSRMALLMNFSTFPDTAMLAFSQETSPDGGTTWIPQGGANIGPGLFIKGVRQTSTTITVTMVPVASGDLYRANLNSSDTLVISSGTLTVT